jgi:hypothetical protein
MTNPVCTVALAFAVTFVLTSGASDAFADTTGSERAAQRVECRHRARQMNFGIHVIKRYRWINECVAGKHIRVRAPAGDL